MLKKINENWGMLNKINNEFDSLYHQVALKSNLSDSSFWVLYSLYFHKKGCTQREICSEWNISKQTINSTIKDLKEKDYIDLSYEGKDKRSKKIVLTKKGKDASKIVEQVVKIENKIIEKTDAKQFDEIIEFFRNQLYLFKEEITKII